MEIIAALTGGIFVFHVLDWNEVLKFVFLHRKKSKQILAYEIEKNDLRKEIHLLKNKAYNLRNFSTFAAILKILHPQCIAIVVRTPPGSAGPKMNVG